MVTLVVFFVIVRKIWRWLSLFLLIFHSYINLLFLGKNTKNERTNKHTLSATSCFLRFLGGTPIGPCISPDSDCDELPAGLIVCAAGGGANRCFPGVGGMEITLLVLSSLRWTLLVWNCNWNTVTEKKVYKREIINYLIYLNLIWQFYFLCFDSKIVMN